MLTAVGWKGSDLIIVNVVELISLVCDSKGLGLDTARQLATRQDVSKVFLACRSQSKAMAAIDQLVKKNGISRSKLEYIHFDASSSKDEISKDLRSLSSPLMGVVLNAGGLGNDKKGLPTSPNSVVPIFQINLVAHAQLIDLLVEKQLLSHGARIVFSGSEAARGVPMMMMGNPALGSNAKWFEDRLEGVTPKRFVPLKAYAEVKGFAALYFAAWARRHSEYTVVSFIHTYSSITA